MKSLPMIDNWSGTLLPGQMSGLIQVVATFTPDREPDGNSVYVIGQCSNTVAGTEATPPPCGRRQRRRLQRQNLVGPLGREGFP